VGLWDRIHKDDVEAFTKSGPAPATTDAGPTINEAVETARSERHEVWGRPGQCPKCGGHGYLDRIDVIDRIMFEHCTDCFHRWQVAEAETQKSDTSF
jgi:hypothetical protein